MASTRYRPDENDDARTLPCVQRSPVPLHRAKGENGRTAGPLPTQIESDGIQACPELLSLRARDQPVPDEQIGKDEIHIEFEAVSIPHHLKRSP
jgi:hypothetical protein